jgi:hypothetical protein
VHVVTLFSPAERMGRTTLAMLLAAALVAGRRTWSVALLDAAAGEGRSELVAWARKLRRRSEEFKDELVARPVRDVGALLGELDLVAAGTRFPTGLAPDLVLIDTAAEVDGRAHVALRAADLVLVPIRSLQGAEQAGPRLKAALPSRVEAASLFCGFEATGAGERERDELRAAKATHVLSLGMAEDLPNDSSFVDVLRQGPSSGQPLEGPAWAMAEGVAEMVVDRLIYYKTGIGFGPPFIA